MDKMKRMEELCSILTEAARAYYAEDREIMPNVTYDRLYDELKELEEETGTVLAGSPTREVGYEAVDFLPKEKHDSPMLSLAKTKSREELRSWLSGREGLLSWKEDGLTVVLTYENGELAKCVTRGNGEVGEVVTANAKTFKNLPLKISFKGKLVLRGEAVIGYKDFEAINAAMPEEGAAYKNPRNLCSGSVRQLDSAVTAKRSVQVIIFQLVSAEGTELSSSMEKRFEFLKGLGFTVVEYERVTPDTVIEAVGRFEKKVDKNDIPSDGLVLSFDDLDYAESLGRTQKFPRGAIAFKWADEMAETTLKYVEWDTSRTGLINPVAVFESVELEGTSVSRASVHNISIIKQLKLGVGDRLLVYKANMIIPQISENLTGSGSLEIPDKCPVCGGEAAIEKDADSEVLRCKNPECPAKKLKSFVHFTERDAMNIEGLSEMTIEKLIAAGLIHRFSDIYRLSEHREVMAGLEGMGTRSADKLLAAVDKSREVSPDRFIHALGIPGVGLANARNISLSFDQSIEKIMNAGAEELAAVDGVGPVMAKAVSEYMGAPGNREEIERMLPELKFTLLSVASDTELSGKTFVVTGSLDHFASRNELKALIESRGGKVSGSVSAKTECLINNDSASASAKNKSAAALGIPVLTEDEFLEKYQLPMS
ncbi:MAG: NAD-dependent DNA ligase LigA [Lachnospiraceae bacterium]|nr:NAD-dependent DNA ligase LigA [Lachnospiraceae bacterium]